MRLAAGKASEYAAMGDAGGMLLASTTTLLMPSLPGALSRFKMAALALLKRRVPLIWLGLRMTCPFSETVPATEQRRVKAVKDRMLDFLHLFNGLADSTGTAAQCQIVLILYTWITDGWHESWRTRNDTATSTSPAHVA